MRSFRPLNLALVLLILSVWISQPAGSAFAAASDSIADRVLGQVDFVVDVGAAGPAGFNNPEDAAIGPDGRLFVADFFNSRILSWPNALTVTTHQSADLVIGQVDV